VTEFASDDLGDAGGKLIAAALLKEGAAMKESAAMKGAAEGASATANLLSVPQLFRSKLTLLNLFVSDLTDQSGWLQCGR
jgi:hypothetical protein